MPKPTNTQELTARYLAAGAGFKPEEQFFALLNAASHVNRTHENNMTDAQWINNLGKNSELLREKLSTESVYEELAADKAPF